MEEYNRMVHMPQQIDNLLQVRINKPEAFDYVLKGAEAILKQKISDDDIKKETNQLLDDFVKAIETALTSKEKEKIVRDVRIALVELDEGYAIIKDGYMTDVIKLLMDETEKIGTNE